MSPRSKAFLAAKSQSFDLALTTPQTAGASIRTLEFRNFPIGIKNKLPLAVGDFRLARLDTGDIGLTVDEAPTDLLNSTYPDRGASIDLALAVHMNGQSMSDLSIAVWVGAWGVDPYLDVSLDYDDGTNEYIELLGPNSLELKSPTDLALSSRRVRVAWLLASPSILLLRMQCSVRTDA